MTASPAPALTLPWRPHAIDALAVELASIDGVAPSTGVAGEITYWQVEHDPVVVGAWAGPGQDLAGWRARLVNRAPRFGDPEAATVCGRPARRQEAAIAAERATGLIAGSGTVAGHLEHRVPAQVQVALATTLADGRPLLIVWVVRADARDPLRGDEAHFLSSIRCR